MKGLLKGLRYISSIFEADEEEPEMEIGFPTDVKHVAHIGWDGPSVTSPSWMTDDKKEKAAHDGGSSRGARSRDLPAMPLPKPPRRHPSSSSSSAAAAASSGVNNSGSPATTKHSRRHQSTSVSSPEPDRPDSTRHGRRERSVTAGSDMDNYASPALQQQDQPDANTSSPNKQRRRKGKGSSSSSGGGSSKPSRSKKDGGKSADRHQPRLKPTREDEEEDEG